MTEEQKVVARLMAALVEARAAGLVSGVVCSTHELLPMTDDEQAEFEEGYDPCIPVIRIW